MLEANTFLYSKYRTMVQSYTINMNKISDLYR